VALGDVNVKNFLPFVKTAGRTHTVGQFSAFTLGADGQRLGFDFPICATLIPALARMPPFRISHEFPPDLKRQKAKADGLEFKILLQPTR